MADIKDMKKEDLVTELASKMKDLQDSGFSFAGATKRNVKEAKNLRREIAQIKTELRSREIASTE